MKELENENMFELGLNLEKKEDSSKIEITNK